MNRKKIVAGNWKMYKVIREAIDLVRGIIKRVGEYRDVEIVVCPPFTALKPVSEIIVDTSVRLGAQNVHWEREGAFTGEISPIMLRDLSCSYVIVGHSERRTYFGETDKGVNSKVKAVLNEGIIPIMCVGETLQEREVGKAQEVVRTQVQNGLTGLSSTEVKKVVIAYEPVWAIGTGKTATPFQAEEMHRFIRSILSDMFDGSTASETRILYGGSIKPSNARELFVQPDIDGGLVGGASLDVESFVSIVEAARNIQEKNR